MISKIWFPVLFCAGAFHLVAQPRAVAPALAAAPAVAEVGLVYSANANEAPRAITFTEGTVTYRDFLANISPYLQVSGEFGFTEKESNVDGLGMRHYLLQQTFQGLEIEGMGYRVHEKNGFLTSANGRAIRAIQAMPQPTLSEDDCFRAAVRLFHPADTVRRQGRKIIVSRQFTFAPESFRVAYQFDLDVSWTAQWRVSIDASTGQVVNQVSRVNTCFHERETRSRPPFTRATGLTNYYGRQTIQVSEDQYRGWWLEGQTANGGKFVTRSYNNVSIIPWLLGFSPPVYHIYSDTNVFNKPYQRTGVSVQWAAEKVYDYFFLKHGRKSYDNQGSIIESLVHVDNELNNAFWSRNTLLFGDGSNNNPLVELDVVSHEFCHGVTQYEAGLQYFNESGALNESFSDIFGKAVEFSFFGDTATWQIAKYFQSGGIRDCSNPNRKQHPDTWMGDLWYTGYEDYGGVHSNSGVQNFWYYLLCMGGSGVNDHRQPYAVSAIGMEAASKIAYRNLTEYLGYFSDYLDSRIGSLLAAADLYGNNSDPYRQTANAWDAVGVIDRPVITKMEIFEITATTAKIKANLVPRAEKATYYFEYGTSLAYGSQTAPLEYKGVVAGLLTGLQSSTKYYVRLVAANENGSSFYPSEFSTISLAPLVNIQHTVDVTASGAALSGAINPNSLPTSYYFEYGLTPSFGSVTPAFSLPDTTVYLAVSASVAGLQPRKTYYYRLVASNSFATTASGTQYFFTADAPRVLAFSPAAAMIGSEVTITGSNFQTTPEHNQVRFGAARATVRAATATQLVVTVPPGASLAPLTVLDRESGLAAQSIQRFVPLFSGAFGSKDLQPVVGINSDVSQTMADDMDGDGRPDIIARHFSGFSVFQNVNQGGDITESSLIRNVFNTNTNANNSPGPTYAADFDGNGLTDIVLTASGSATIYPNLSVPGYVFFGQPVELPQIGYFAHIAADDFDHDGRVDIMAIMPRGDSSIVNIYRNHNPKGFLESKNFLKALTFKLPEPAQEFATGDLNNDGKPDFILSRYDRKFYSVFANESGPGSFAFKRSTIEDPFRERNPNFVVQDFNQDGWADILSYQKLGEGQNMTLLENGKTAPHITFSPSVVLRNGNSQPEAVPADLNGDGKVDFLIASLNNTFTFFKNTAAAGQAFTPQSFLFVQEFGMKTTGSGALSYLTVNDLNGDGRPEVINSSINFGIRNGYNLEIWQNAPANCPDPANLTVRVIDRLVTITLPPDLKFADLEVGYSQKGTTNWSLVDAAEFTLPYRGSFQLRIRAKCYLNFTDYAYWDIVTDCIDHRDFAIRNIQWNSATVQGVYLSVMEVQYSQANKNQWQTLSPYSTQITNLAAGTTYDVRYRGRCTVPAPFVYTRFTTACPKLDGITITDLRFNSAKVNWTGVGAGNVVLEYSSDHVNWTRVGPDQVMANLKPAQHYVVRGKRACTDLDSDFISTSFTTPCPNVSGLGANAARPFDAHIVWSDESNTNAYVVAYQIDGREPTLVTTLDRSFQLSNLEPGTRCSVSVAPVCTGSLEFRQVEFTTLCFMPADVVVSGVTHTSAEVSWEDPFGGVPYFVDYSIYGSNRWTTLETTSKTVSLTNLRPATHYELMVRIKCASVQAPVVQKILKTAAYGETTLAPNPTQNSITIYPAADLIGRRFSIYDRAGRQAATGTVQEYTLDVSALLPGVYTLAIDGEAALKFVRL